MIQLISRSLEGFRDPDAWRMSKNGRRIRSGVQAVKLDPAGLEFETQIGRIQAGWQSQQIVCAVDGVPQPQARVTLSLRHQILKPLILVIQFDQLAIGDERIRVRFDIP